MKLERFFVTFVAILVMGWVAHLKVRRTPTEAQTQLVEEGNAKISALEVLQNEFSVKYKIFIGERVEWKNFSKVQRNEIKGKVARYLGALQRVLEIDATKNIFIENREALLESRNRAEGVQKSVEEFEKLFGENFDPKRDGSENSIKTVDN